MLSTSEILQAPQIHARAVLPRPCLERFAPRAPAVEAPSPRTNRVLAALAAPAYQRIVANLEPVTLSSGDVLCESGRRLRHVYFPTTSVVSLLCETADGKSIEICAVGNEGLVGFASFMGGETTGNRAVVLDGGHGFRLESQLLKREFCLSGSFMQVLLRYTQALITQMTQAAVCNRHHSVDQQLPPPATEP